MEQTLEDIRAPETPSNPPRDDGGSPENAGPAVWVVDMKSHRIVRRRVQRRHEPSLAYHLDR
jgi:hypothetical protein